MSLSIGSRVGRYEIVALLGAGGMGEVYRARDTALNREVAIKVVPAALSADPERLQRFAREAKILASLNHPNIAQVHGFEEPGSAGADGLVAGALVMELVEGETLAERIAHGALALDDALAVARQVADALEAAHAQGIIHRDLKPANIKVRPDGTVKVLDFGLAKLASPDSASPSSLMANSPTLTAHATELGLILGTAAYMAPEQAKGKTVDKRADIWAFGVVLFEMLSGRPLFDGETISEVLAGILKEEPTWSALPPDTPPSIRRLLERCLEKDQKYRVTTDGAMAGRWMPDGRILFLRDRDRQLFIVDVDAGPSFHVGTPRALATLPKDLVDMDSLRDRSKFLALRPVDDLVPASLTVVLNWTAALRKR